MIRAGAGREEGEGRRKRRDGGRREGGVAEAQSAAKQPKTRQKGPRKLPRYDKGREGIRTTKRT